MAEFKCSRDGSVCSLSCGHPHCWRVLRTLNRSPSYCSESIGGRQTSQEDEGLPTLKVSNMLDDYGESPLDLFPSKFGGRASHQRGDIVYGTRRVSRSQADAASSLRRRPEVARRGGGLSRSADGALGRGGGGGGQVSMQKTLRSVEVQEVFDVEELKEYWDETFVARPVYVWMPGGGGGGGGGGGKSRTRKKKENKEASDSGLCLNKATKGPEVLPIRNLTNELIPAFSLQPSSAQDILEKAALLPENATVLLQKKDIHEKVPLPTGGQPYPNVGLVPHDRRQQLLNELKDLPKDFLLEILEKVKNLTDTDELIRLVEKYVSLMPRTRQDFLLAIGDVLQQKKLEPAEAVWISSLQQSQPAASASKTYRLDSAIDLSSGIGARHREQEEEEEEEQEQQQQEQRSRISHYMPLPGIAGYVDRQTKARRIYTNVGTVRYTARPFNYESSSIDFSLGPIFTPPRSRYDRSARSRLSSLSDLDYVRSEAVVDSESPRDSRETPYGHPRDYAEGAAAAEIWSASSSSGRAPPKPPVGTPYTPYALFRAAAAAAPAASSAAAGADYRARGSDAAVDAIGSANALQTTAADDVAAYKRQWALRTDYWDDVRRHALLTAIDEGDERGHDLNRAEKAGLPRATLKLTSDPTSSHLGARTASPLPRPNSRKTSAKSQADSASLQANEDPSSEAFRSSAAVTRASESATPEHPRSAASHWPQVDEEALLQRESDPLLPPLSSADASHRSARLVHVPTAEFEAEAEDTRHATPTSTAPQVHETPELGEYKEAVLFVPMPPPPSPELRQSQSPAPRGHEAQDASASFEPIGSAHPAASMLNYWESEERMQAERPPVGQTELEEPHKADGVEDDRHLEKSVPAPTAPTAAVEYQTLLNYEDPPSASGAAEASGSGS